MKPSQDKSLEQYLTEKDVARITGLSLAKLRSDRFLGQGIRYAKIGKSVRYRYQDVIDFMNSHMINFPEMLED